MKYRCILPGALAALLLAAGCASAPEPSYAEADGIEWNLSSVSAELGGEDDYEGLNRVMFEAQYYFMAYLVRPIGGIYGSIMPRFMIKGFRNMCSNLEFPRRAVSSLVQGKTHGAGVESLRFLTNTTLGIAGFFDVAESWFDLHEHDEDFGQAFKAGGMARGATLILPRASGTSMRDLLGAICDAALDGKTYIPYAGGFTALNSSVSYYRSFIRLIEANSDPYEMYKTFMIFQRELKFNDFKERADERADGIKARSIAGFISDAAAAPGASRPEGFTGNWTALKHYSGEFSEIDTLRASMSVPQRDESSIWPHLSLFNTDFTRQARFGSVAVESGRPKMNYYFWEQDEKPDSPLVVIVPGIASYYTNPMAVALAELFHHNGYQSATISNAFCWQFIESAGMTDFPGYSVRDAAAVKRAVFAMIDDIAANYNHRPSQIIMTGYSLGALHLLHMAAQEDPADKYRIARYVAINPPVDMHHALRAADTMALTSKNWTRREAMEKIPEAAGVFFAISGRPHPTYDPEFSEKYPPWRYRVPVDRTQARFLIGMALRMALRDILSTAVKKHGQVENIATEYRWSGRSPLYREIDRFSFEDYMRLFALTDYNRDAVLPVSAERLEYLSGLRSIAPVLAANTRIRVVHNFDDFLLSKDDKVFLDSSLGSRMYWFDAGGHLGNFYMKQYADFLLTLMPPPDGETENPGAARPQLEKTP